MPGELGEQRAYQAGPSQRELKHCAPPAPARELYQPPLPTLPNLTLRVLSEELSQRPENIATASLRRSPRPYDRKPSGKGHLTSELATAQGRTGQAASAGMQRTCPGGARGASAVRPGRFHPVEHPTSGDRREVKPLEAGASMAGAASCPKTRNRNDEKNGREATTATKTRTTPRRAVDSTGDTGPKAGCPRCCRRPYASERHADQRSALNYERKSTRKTHGKIQ